MWVSWVRGFSVSSITWAKFILDMYVICTLALVYLIWIPLEPHWILTLGFVAGVLYVGHQKMQTIHMEANPILAHVLCYVAWIHGVALLSPQGIGEPHEGWNHHYFFSITLIETITLDTTHVKGSVGGALWYLLLLGVTGTHVLYVYWTVTHRVQLIPPVKRYQLIPPPRINKKG